MMINSLFDVLKNLTSVKDPDDLESPEYKPYMINRFISMNPQYIEYANLLNKHSHLDKKQQELLLFYLLPKKYSYFKYKKNNKNESKNFKIIQEKYNLSDKKSEEMVNFLNKLQNRRNGL